MAEADDRAPHGRSTVELNANNCGNQWMATEHVKAPPAFGERARRVYVDPDRMIAARKEGASPWELHERAFAGGFAPTQPYDPRTPL